MWKFWTAGGVTWKIGIANVNSSANVPSFLENLSLLLRYFTLDQNPTTEWWINIAIPSLPNHQCRYKWNKRPSIIQERPCFTDFFYDLCWLKKTYNAESISENQSHSNIPEIKTITIWSLLKSHENPRKNIYHDSVSRFREIIILITSFEPSGETKEKNISHKLKLLQNHSTTAQERKRKEMNHIKNLINKT